MTIGAVVVVVIETGSDAVEVVVDTVWAEAAAAAAAMRIQHFTPRLRPRAPSMSTELVIPRLLI